MSHSMTSDRSVARWGSKLLMARALDALGLTRLGIVLQRSCFSPHIRILYYHDVAPSQRDAFEAQLVMLRQYYEPASREDLRELLARGRWRHRKPGIIITFDDGLRSSLEVIAPALEKHGFQGWFFVPIGLITMPVPEQPQSADRQLVTHANDVLHDPRVFLSTEQLRELGRRHVIGCHTINHVRLSDSLSPATLDAEILHAKQLLETALGQSVDSFAWVGGEEWAYSRGAAQRVESAFRYAFTTNTRPVRPTTSPLELDRTHLEADNPLWLVRFQLSGIMDLRHAPKRRRVAKLLGYGVVRGQPVRV
jgi:peptidoglycan/xylan/chitin deacetylase (PgdA/CDA1 family)